MNYLYLCKNERTIYETLISNILYWINTVICCYLLLFAVSTTVLAPEQAFAGDKSKKEHSKKSDKSDKHSKKSDKEQPNKVVICHQTPYGGVVIDVSKSSLPAHNSHGDRLVDAFEGLELGDACDCPVYLPDTDGDGFGDPLDEVEFCSPADPGFILPGTPDLCPTAPQFDNAGCPFF
ncbi:MAG: hypothetical protein ACI82A_001724 [Candidatus Azotimanducaceae bacterium]